MECPLDLLGQEIKLESRVVYSTLLKDNDGYKSVLIQGRIVGIVYESDSVHLRIKDINNRIWKPRDFRQVVVVEQLLAEGS